jgi:hypothetical protein
MPPDYPQMRVRPVCEGAVGVTISETQYVLSIADLGHQHAMIGEVLASGGHVGNQSPITCPSV